MKKNKIKKIEMSKLFNNEIVLHEYSFFNDELEKLYYDYLNNKNIELMHNKKNLLECIKDSKEALLNIESNEEAMKAFDKKQRLILLKKCIFGTSLFLALYSLHIVGKDVAIHEESNIKNSSAMLNDLSLSKLSGMPEVYTSLLNYIDLNSKPTNYPFYANSNIFYNLSDELRVLDNISFAMAMDELGYDVVKIDNVIYSMTGKITEILYTENEVGLVNYTSRTFETEKELIEYLIEISKNPFYDRKIEDVTSKTYDVKFLEDIPTIYKNKEDGIITSGEPIGNFQFKLAQKLFD